MSEVLMIFKALDASYVDEMHTIEVNSTGHPMSHNLLASCFGPLYRVVGVFEQNTEDQSYLHLMGFVVLHQILDEATLMDICIDASVQGKGVGKKLMQYVIEQLLDTDTAVLMLEVRASNHSAIGLYQSLQFDEVGTRRNYYRTQSGMEDAVLMQLQIKNSA